MEMSKHSAIARILKLEKKLKKRNKKIKKLKKRLTCPECGEPRDYGPGEGCQSAHDMGAQLKAKDERIAELEAERDKYVSAVGIATTIKDTMIVDAENPEAMMLELDRHVADLREQLTAEREKREEAEKAMLSPSDLALYRKGWVDCEKYYCGTGEDRSVPVDIAPREEGETLTEFLTRLHEEYERTKKNSIQFD